MSPGTARRMVRTLGDGRQCERYSSCQKHFPCLETSLKPSRGVEMSAFLHWRPWRKEGPRWGRRQRRTKKTRTGPEWACRPYRQPWRDLEYRARTRHLRRSGTSGRWIKGWCRTRTLGMRWWAAVNIELGSVVVVWSHLFYVVDQAFIGTTRYFVVLAPHLLAYFTANLFFLVVVTVVIGVMGNPFLGGDVFSRSEE